MNDDEFAKKYLGSESAVHSERVTHRAVFALLVLGIVFTIASLGVGVGALLTNPALFAAAGALFVTGLVGMFLGLFFATSRIVVSKDTLVIHHGRERRIPRAAITEAAVVTMDRAARNRMRREHASDFGARAGRTHAVRVAYTEGSESNVVYLPANDPAALVNILSPKVRVKAEELAAAENELEDEAESVEPARMRT